MDPDARERIAVQEQLDSLEAIGIEGTRGVWLYGDHRTALDIHSALACHDACAADNQCSHWNYHVTGHHKCDLKNGFGGFNADATDWVSGNIVHLPDPTAAPTPIPLTPRSTPAPTPAPTPPPPTPEPTLETPTPEPT